MQLTTTGKVREALADCLVRMANGELAANDAKAIIGLANQITNNIAVELKVKAVQSSLGQAVSNLGQVAIGDSND